MISNIKNNWKVAGFVLYFLKYFIGGSSEAANIINPINTNFISCSHYKCVLARFKLDYR